MKYTLWDTETSNQFGQFEDEIEVFTLIRTLADHYGACYAEDLGLGRVTDEGVILEPLSGAALIAHVDQVLAGGLPADESGNEFIESRSRNREIA